jgi:HPt (histidine-containing phosphotransfer) domain-containing protein
MALLRAGGNIGVLREIAMLFLDNHGKWLAEIREAAAHGDAQALERGTHGLKGSVANFGAEAAVEAALELEQIGRRRDLA